MPLKLSEERTRKEMIDPQLEQAGWYLHNHVKVKTEIPVDGYDAEPMMAGEIALNPSYGFRVKATLENPDLWYVVNKYFAQRLFVVAVVGVLAVAGLYFLPGISIDAYALSVLGVFVIAFGAAMWQSLRYLKSIQ